MNNINKIGIVVVLVATSAAYSMERRPASCPVYFARKQIDPNAAKKIAEETMRRRAKETRLQSIVYKVSSMQPQEEFDKVITEELVPAFIEGVVDVERRKVYGFPSTAEWIAMLRFGRKEYYNPASDYCKTIDWIEGGACKGRKKSTRCFEVWARRLEDRNSA